MKHLSLALIAVLAACPKSGDKKPTDPVPSKDAAGGHTLPRIDDADTAVQLPPAPALPAVPAGLPPPPALPGVTPDAVALGELLFHDTRLSTTGKHACAICHEPAHGYSGGTIDLTAAGKPNLRRAPALTNLAWVKELGWDGRYPSIADLLPAHIKGQLGQPLQAGLAKVLELPLYRAHLARVGGDPQTAAIQALSAFVLTRYEGGSPWDAMENTARAPKPGVTPDPIVAGYVVFAGKGQCAVCHPPPLYTDGAYHVVVDNPSGDPGRGFVDKALIGAFRTPTLRGAVARAAFFHTGKHTTLDSVLSEYQKNSQSPGTFDPIVAKIQLTPQDREHLRAFLTSLSATRAGPAPAAPALP